jgi:integrase
VQYIAAQESGWKSSKHAAQWSSTLETYAYPIIGKLPVASIDKALVLKVLQPIWSTKTETASRVRGRIEKILDWARSLDLRTGENPAAWRGHLEFSFPKKSQVAPVEHHAALPYVELPTFMTKLRARDGISARALEFTILTVARTGDTIGATHSEIDTKEKLWTVPAARVKGKKGARKRDHVVPLSSQATAVLEDLPVEADFVFAGGKEGKPLSNMAMAELLKEMGYSADAATVHGFRSTFKDWCSEQTAYPNELSEMAMAHTVSDKVEAAYRRGDMREKRRRLMADWATFCDRKTGGGKNVVAIGGRK